MNDCESAFILRLPAQIALGALRQPFRSGKTPSGKYFGNTALIHLEDCSYLVLQPHHLIDGARSRSRRSM